MYLFGVQQKMHLQKRLYLVTFYCSECIQQSQSLACCCYFVICCFIFKTKHFTTHNFQALKHFLSISSPGKRCLWKIHRAEEGKLARVVCNCSSSLCITPKVCNAACCRFQSSFPSRVVASKQCSWKVFAHYFPLRALFNSKKCFFVAIIA